MNLTVVLPSHFFDRLCFDPLCKFVDCDQHVRMALDGVYKLAHNVESPDHERPGDGDCLESRPRKMCLVGVPLTTVAVIDDVDCVGVGRGLVEAMAQGLGDKRA